MAVAPSHDVLFTGTFTTSHILSSKLLDRTQQNHSNRISAATQIARNELDKSDSNFVCNTT